MGTECSKLNPEQVCLTKGYWFLESIKTLSCVLPPVCLPTFQLYLQPTNKKSKKEGSGKKIKNLPLPEPDLDTEEQLLRHGIGRSETLKLICHFYINGHERSSYHFLRSAFLLTLEELSIVCRFECSPLTHFWIVSAPFIEQSTVAQWSVVKPVPYGQYRHGILWELSILFNWLVVFYWPVLHWILSPLTLRYYFSTVVTTLEPLFLHTNYRIKLSNSYKTLFLFELQLHLYINLNILTLKLNCSDLQRWQFHMVLPKRLKGKWVTLFW